MSKAYADKKALRSRIRLECLRENQRQSLSDEHLREESARLGWQGYDQALTAAYDRVGNRKPAPVLSYLEPTAIPMDSYVKKLLAFESEEDLEAESRKASLAISKASIRARLK